MTKVDRWTMKRVLSAEAEVAYEILHRIIDRLPLLSSPLEVERRMYGLSPTTEFDREVESSPQNLQISHRVSPRFFQGTDVA